VAIVLFFFTYRMGHEKEKQNAGRAASIALRPIALLLG
jgi:hypothetical protein